VGTPGRVWQLVNEGLLQMKFMRVLVLDEADVMLSEGFKDKVQEIFRYSPADMQCAIFSATISPEVVDVAGLFMHDPLRILVKPEDVTLKGIQQYFIALEEEHWKFDTLCDLYKDISVAQTIIYCNTRRRVEALAAQMIEDDFSVSQIHGEMSPQERNAVMREFRAGKSRVLIATNVIARGIDIQQVSLVINYELPFEKENYIHRIGRSGRHARKGMAINFVTPGRDVQKMRELESFYSTDISPLPADYAIRCLPNGG